MKKAIELQGHDAILEYHLKEVSDCADPSKVNVKKYVNEIVHFVPSQDEYGNFKGIERRFYSKSFIMELYNAMKANECGFMQITRTQLNSGKDPYDDLPF